MFFILTFLFLACDSGMYGKECSGTCNCSAQKSCDPITGNCLCPPGRSGERCDEGEFLTQY